MWADPVVLISQEMEPKLALTAEFACLFGEFYASPVMFCTLCQLSRSVMGHAKYIAKSAPLSGRKTPLG